MVDNIEIKKYIYDNISKSHYNHYNIINYIKSKKIDYSQNNNGIFLNISKLNINDLIKIKSLMLSESYIKDDTNKEPIKEFDNSSCFIKKDIDDKKNEKTFKKLKISNSIEKDIIKYSKIYDLINELHN